MSPEDRRPSLLPFLTHFSGLSPSYFLSFFSASPSCFLLVIPDTSQGYIYRDVRLCIYRRRTCGKVKVGISWLFFFFFFLTKLISLETELMEQMVLGHCLIRNYSFIQVTVYTCVCVCVCVCVVCVRACMHACVLQGRRLPTLLLKARSAESLTTLG